MSMDVFFVSMLVFGALVKGQDQLTPNSCKRVLWFSAMAQELGTADWDLYLAALTSAQTNAPMLQPVLLWLGPTEENGLWRTWLQQQGVLIINHVLSFQALAEEAQAKGWVHSVWLASRYTYAVIDVPAVAQTLRAALDPDDFQTQHVLWSEPAVYFVNPVDSCSFNSTKLVALGPEAFATGVPTSSAVMYLHVDAMALEQHAIVETAVQRKWNTVAGVQGLIQEHFKSRLDYLKETLNYKPYWGVREDAQLVYFHGIKPTDSCWDCFVKHKSLAVHSNTTGGCSCNQAFEGIIKMALESDKGQLYEQLSEGWHAAVTHARSHYRNWHEVYLMAHSHMNYIRARALRQGTWKARQVAVRTPFNLAMHS